MRSDVTQLKRRRVERTGQAGWAVNTQRMACIVVIDQGGVPVRDRLWARAIATLDSQAFASPSRASMHFLAVKLFTRPFILVIGVASLPAAIQF
ncbi:hypothetical protein K469DRAFT_698748 [Zopfia rhizophila CBS 207.26]|uniref:Uncharacterized protein n=1 Tax=Zopfia rhizophila CBS 207.26 TaxID=1314779 RepID=A0A6A6EW06_9PEZI|nr:hypothetical protein K469DRAFT_698748 [Zopfia rhizophila CBS 207.26]